MWFLSKIKYSIQDEKGNSKAIVEQFIQEGITYAEVETQLATLLDGRVTDYEYDLSKIKFGSVYEPFNDGAFYKVTIDEKTTDERGKEKINILTHYVIAESVSDAEIRANAYMNTWVTDTTVKGAIQSKVLAVWHPHDSQWQDDFKQRMLRLAEEGHESADSNQTTIFDKEGKPKVPGLGGATVSVKGPDGNWVDVTEGLKKISKHANVWKPYADD